MTFIDTSIVIDFLSGDKEIAALIEVYSKKGKLKTTTVTEYELLKYKNDVKRQVASSFLETLTVCPFDRFSAAKAALLFQKLSDAGKKINENDVLIAGIALANSEVLLTRDRKFANIGDSNIKIV